MRPKCFVYDEVIYFICIWENPFTRHESVFYKLKKISLNQILMSSNVISFPGPVIIFISIFAAKSTGFVLSLSCMFGEYSQLGGVTRLLRYWYSTNRKILTMLLSALSKNEETNYKIINSLAHCAYRWAYK